MNRAINDEAMQQLNILFAEKNSDYYSEVERKNAALRATKGEPLCLTNYYKMDSLFSNCKNWIDSIQNEFLCNHNLQEFSSEYVYKTSEIKTLNDGFELDVTAIINRISITCYSVVAMLERDTIKHMFAGLEPTTYIDNPNYPFSTFSLEMDSVISEFKNTYQNANNVLPLIDILEFFTLARSTILVAERKSIRFHNEIVLTRPESIPGKKIDVAVQTNKPVYSPGEQIIFQPYLTILHSSSLSKLSYTYDSIHTVQVPLTSANRRDTVYLNTATPGNFSLSVEYTSGGKNSTVFKDVYYYTVLPK